MNVPKRRFSKLNNSVQIKASDGLKAKLAEIQNSDTKSPDLASSTIEYDKIIDKSVLNLDLLYSNSVDSSPLDSSLLPQHKIDE